jgi:hypothetical protein
MPAKPTNVERLQEADVIDPRGFTDTQLDAINKLTESEVKQLISIRKKVGNYSRPTHHGGCAWIL